MLLSIRFVCYKHFGVRPRRFQISDREFQDIHDVERVLRDIEPRVLCSCRFAFVMLASSGDVGIFVQVGIVPELQAILDDGEYLVGPTRSLLVLLPSGYELCRPDCDPPILCRFVLSHHHWIKQRPGSGLLAVLLLLCQQS